MVAPPHARGAPVLRVLIGLLAASLVWLLASGVRAQGNDLSAPTGGRSTLMGNTGVALARDGSAPFYNPATIVRIRDERLAFSVNFYSLEIAHFSDWYRPGPIDSDYFGDRGVDETGLTQTSFRALPDSLCLFFTLEDLASIATLKTVEEEETKQPTKKLAACFATLESDDVDMQALGYRGMTAAGVTTQAQSMQRRWNRTYIGPTYSQYLSKSFALGGSIQVVYSDGSFGLNSSSLSAARDGQSVASTLGASGNGHSFELTALIGATYAFDGITFGASVRTPSLHLFGDYTGTVNRTDSTSTDGTLIVEGTGSMVAPPPTRIATGVGFTWPRLTLEIDLALDLPLQHTLETTLDVRRYTVGADGVDLNRSRETLVIDGVATLHPSIGLEYFVRPGLSALGGVSLNFSSLGQLESSGAVGNPLQARTNHISLSLGIGSYWRGGELLFGVQGDYAWGQSLAINPYAVPNVWGVIDRQAYRLMFVMAGASSLNAILGAVKKIAGADDSSTGEHKPAAAQPDQPPPTPPPNQEQPR